jgi:hypothetical protein
MDNNKRGPGRPRLEVTMNPEWYKIIIDAGKEGQNVTQFLLTLGISWEGHNALLKRNKKYYEAVQQYKILCEQYWFNLAHNSMSQNGGNGFNSRLWSLMVRNMFPQNWSESTKIDVNSKVEEINKQPIHIEIIRKSIEDENQK